MKYVISERQYRLLKEQKDETDYYTGRYSYYGTYGYDKEGKTPWTDMDPHTKNLILGIAASFLPIVGPAISMGIGLYDAKLYLDEGDPNTAAMVAIFSMLPAVGGLAAKLGLGKWSAKSLGEIGKKISKGLKLSPTEIQVAKKVAQNEKLIKREIDLVKKTVEKNTKQNVTKTIVQDFVEGSMKSFKENMKKRFPMTEEEAVEFIRNFNKRTGKNYMADYNSRGFGFAGGDNIWVATVLKNNLKPPVGKYLYHGTSTTNFKNISKKGLDNSLGELTNPGSMSDNLGAGVTTATGNVDAASTFANGASKVTKGKPLIVRFPNVNKHNMGFFSKHDAVSPKVLEFSLDGGSTWSKTIK